MNHLPDGWTTRRPTLDDVPEILAMVQASNIAALGEPDFSADEVVEALTTPHTDPERDCWLAVDGAGAAFGWAYPDNASAGDREFIEVYVHPEHGGPARRPLLDLLLARVAERAALFGHDPVTVRAGALPIEQDWVDALNDVGFAFVARYSRMRRSLADVPPTVPEPPDGVTVRPVDPVDDAELRQFHAVLEEAFQDSHDYAPTDYAAWQARLAALPSIAYDEWFVAEIDGAWAGVLQSADQGLHQNEAWVKMLAVRQAHRRRGIGGALLRHAFACYAAKGRATVGLGVDLANPTQAVRLYRAVGMTPTFEVDTFERQVAAATPR